MISRVIFNRVYCIDYGDVLPFLPVDTMDTLVQQSTLFMTFVLVKYHPIEMKVSLAVVISKKFNCIAPMQMLYPLP